MLLIPDRMKTPLLRVVFALCAAGTVWAADSSTAPKKAVVNFDHWEKFADVKDNYSPTERGQQEILQQISDYLVQDAGHVVPNGDLLTITFQDIHLAGEFEPWRGAQWDGIRVVKDIYPPHFKFTWALTNSGGTVVKQGQEDIVDLNFQMRITAFRDDPLRYEKQILDEWMHRATWHLKTS